MTQGLHGQTFTGKCKQPSAASSVAQHTKEQGNARVWHNTSSKELKQSYLFYLISVVVLHHRVFTQVVGQIALQKNQITLQRSRLSIVRIWV